VFLLGAGNLIGLGFVFGFVFGLVFGLVVMLVFGLVFGFVIMWSSPVADSAEATPRLTHHQDAQRGLGRGLGGGLIFGLGFGLLFGLAGGLGGGLAGGLVFGLAGGLVFGLVGAAGQLLVAEAVLAIKGRRVRFIRFLEAGLDGQVLRQAGTVYQFRHAELQDRLAERFARDHLRTGRPSHFRG
jgi:MFS family permease